MCNCNSNKNTLYDLTSCLRIPSGILTVPHSPKSQHSLEFTNNVQIAKNNMTAGMQPKKGQPGFIILFFFGGLSVGGLGWSLSRTPKATESAIHIDTTCQFCVRQVAGGRRVVSCGFAGVTRPAASKRTCKDATESGGREWFWGGANSS